MKASDPAHWRCIVHSAAAGSYGLAVDEAIMQFVAARPAVPILHLYVFHPPTVVIGYHQTVSTEVNLEACQRLGVAYNRRLTGGGSILMADDQLGLALAISQTYPGMPQGVGPLFQKLSRGIIDALAEMGIEAILHRKNDIVVNSRKICGIGAYVDEQGVILFHASLLVDFDFDLMAQVLRIPPEKLEDKPLALAGAGITTINKQLQRKTPMDQVMEEVRLGYERSFGVRILRDAFTGGEERTILALQEGKYSSEDWIFFGEGRGEEASSALRKTVGGLIAVSASVAEGVIEAIRIRGDFFADRQAIAALERELRGKSGAEEIAETVQRRISGEHIWLVDPRTLVEVILEAVTKAREKRVAKEAAPCFYRPMV